MTLVVPGCIVSIQYVQLELWMISAILSAMAYGGVLSLTLSYIPLLMKTSYIISRRMRNFLLAYVTFMVATSTVYIITVIVAVRDNIDNIQFQVSGSDKDCTLFAYTFWGLFLKFQNGLGGALCIMLANWGADGFMLWRCAMLYRGVSRLRRIVLLTVLVFMALMSFGSSIALLFPGTHLFLFYMTLTTVTLNLVASALITFRILYFYRYMRNTVGLERNSPYMTIIVICVESSALIVVFSSIYLVLFFKTNLASIIPLQSLVHVYVISPLLIVYRVAQGRVATIRQRSSGNGPVVSALYFEPQFLSLNNDAALEV